jgi:DHA2 family multidrug resistance protein
VLVEYGLRRILVVGGVMLAALLQTLDTTIVNVALPTIQGNLGATIDEGTFVVTAYVIAAVIVIPITPWLQIRLGRKRYFLISIAGFTIASILCGISGTITELIIFRVVQGLFGGGLLATAQAILRDTFPPEELALSQAIYTLGAVVGPSAGPTLGGLLTDNVSWNWVFDVNVVPGIVAFVVLFFTLKDPPKAKASPIDGIGLALLAVTVGSLQFVLDEGERQDWFGSTTIFVLSCTAVLGIIAFALWETRGTLRPIVDLRVLRFRSVAVGSVLAMVNAALVFGQLLILPQFYDALSYPATQIGELIALRAIPIALLTIPIAIFARKIDPRLMIFLGLAVAGAGSVGLGLDTTTGANFITAGPWLVMTGFGISFVFTPLLTAVLGAVPRVDSPKAGAFISLALQLGGSICSALLVTFLDRRGDFHRSVLAANANAGNFNVQNFLNAHGTLEQLSSIINGQAGAEAYADAFVVLGILTMIASPVAWLLAKPAKALA